MADAAAMAILNARLYAQSRRELRRRDALRKVVASISSELDLDSLLGRVADSAVELLDADSGVISLIDREGAARVRAVHNFPTHVVGTVLGPGDGITGQVLATRAARDRRALPATRSRTRCPRRPTSSPAWPCRSGGRAS